KALGALARGAARTHAAAGRGGAVQSRQAALQACHWCVLLCRGGKSYRTYESNGSYFVPRPPVSPPREQGPAGRLLLYRRRRLLAGQRLDQADEAVLQLAPRGVRYQRHAVGA